MPLGCKAISKILQLKIKQNKQKMRFYVDKDDICLRDSETNFVLCRTEKDIIHLENQLKKLRKQIKEKTKK